MVVLEAMTAGLPVLSTRVGGIPDALPQGSRMVQPGSPSDLADGMSELLDISSCDRQRMQVAVAQHAQQTFGVDAMIDDYMNVFAEVRGGESPPMSSGK